MHKQLKIIKRQILWAYKLLALFGIDPRKTIGAIRGLFFYFRDFRMLCAQKNISENKYFSFGEPYPCLNDRFSESGSANGHYFYQDLLVAQRIYLTNPKIHVDIGSRVDGFVAHVASFRPIEVMDIRPLSSNISNVKFIQSDLTGCIKHELIDYCDSLSCLHALEHFGLGRYGEQVNYDGYLLGLDNLYSILKKKGKLYLSVPIGPQRIEFTAHRVFSIGYLLSLFMGKYQIDLFSFVDDSGELHKNVELNDENINSNFNCYYGCGVFEMTKL